MEIKYDKTKQGAKLYVMTNMSRKIAYVKAAYPLTLAEWIIKQLDAAAEYKEETKK